MKMMPIAIG
jgi:C4-dicarboxylate-specific signal transduction histidine kinase